MAPPVRLGRKPGPLQHDDASAPRPGPAGKTCPAPRSDLGSPHAVWQNRLNGAKEQLERWRTKRARVVKEIKDLVAKIGVIKSEKTDPADEAKLKDLHDRKLARLDKDIRSLERTVDGLESALKTCEFVTPVQKLEISIRDAPDLIHSHVIARVSRGDEVILIAPNREKTDWWWVRTKAGVEGWVKAWDGLPERLLELSDEPGGPDPYPNDDLTSELGTERG